MNRKPEKAKKVAKTLSHQSEDGVPSDTLGSYTGTPIADERPVQDADDL